jgi:hypothetical protein
MKYNIIQTENYLIIAEDCKINVGDYGIGYAHGINGIGEGWFLFLHDDSNKARLNVLCEDTKKVIAHLPLRSSPVLNKVDLLMPIEKDNIDRLANEYNNVPKLDAEFIRAAFKGGFRKAKELYKYTEENLRKAYDFGSYNHHAQFTHEYDEQKNSHMQSLKEPRYPIEFEFEFTKLKTEDLGNGFSEYEFPIQTIWIGKYIF